MLYRLNNVVRRFGSRTVLEIDQLTFEARKVYALIGPNGAGKTTLLNQLAFLDQPNSGEISFRSEPVRYEHSVLTQLRRKVVLVDQSPILFSGTVWKNIEFGLKVRKIPKKERTLKIEQALEQVTMSDFAHADVHGLSGGEVKRLALARALALEPEVLLCDEPTANVDREHQEVILKILAHANSIQNTTVIFSTHYLSQSRRLAHHTLLLQNGRLSKHLEENIFSGRIVKHGDTLMIRMGDAHLIEFTDPKKPVKENEQVRMHIDPDRLKLAAAEDEIKAGQTSLTGRIQSISQENGKIRIVVDIGMLLQVVMKADVFIDRPFQVLQPVEVVVPRQSVYVLS